MYVSAQCVVQSVTHLSSVVSVWVFFLLACGALCGVASAEGHRLPLSTLRLHSLHTREEVGEVEDVREKTATDLCLDSCLSLCACTFRAVRERDVQSPDVRSGVCTGCGAVSRSCLLSRQWGTFLFSVRGAVWRRVCGRSPPPGPKGATSTSALTARFAPSRYAHTEEVTCPLALSSSDSGELASAEYVSLSTRVTRVNQHPVDSRYLPPNRGVHKGEPASG